jgi:hypothetical protein
MVLDNRLDTLPESGDGSKQAKNGPLAEVSPDSGQSTTNAISDASDPKDSVSEESQSSNDEGYSLDNLTFSNDDFDTSTGDYADSVISSVLTQDGIGYLNQAYNFFRDGSMLEKEDWGIWKAILQAKKGDFKPKKEFVHSYLSAHRAEIESSSNYDKKDYTPIAGDTYLGFLSSVENKFSELISKEPLDSSTFNQNLELFKEAYQNKKTSEILQNGLDAIGEGITVRGKKIQGYSAAQEYIKSELAKLVANLDSTQGGGYLSADAVEERYEQDDSLATKHVTNLSGLPTFNKNTGGLSTRTLVSILAPEKSGKTKFCVSIAHDNVLAGGNTSVLSLEDGAYEFETQVRACHFNYFYNNGKSLTDRKYGVSSDSIIKRNLPPEIESLEVNSNIDLKDTSNGHGNIEYIDVNNIDANNIIDVIEESIRHNNSNLVIIDYPQLIPWIGIYNSQREMLESIYKALLQCAKRNNVCIVTPAQMTQEALKGIAKNGISNSDLRTSAGGSYEITKSADVIFALYGTVQDIEAGNLQLISLPSRRNPPFGTIDMHVDLAVCQFTEITKRNQD